MRRILIPIGGKSTDTKGNASFDLGLEKTGEWRMVKVSANLPSPAEWALSSAGSTLTYGRGRRVTLGPELLEPQDVLQLQVTGGPVTQPITGAVVGVSGTMEEVMASYAPQPNTIATDITGQQVLLGSVTAPANQTRSTSFPVPAGTVTIGYAIDFSVGGNTPQNVVITGDQTTDVYRQDTPPVSPPVVHAALLAAGDTSVTLLVQAAVATASKVLLLAWPFAATETVGLDLLDPIPVTFNDGLHAAALPAPWQAPNQLPLRFAANAGGGATTAIIAAPGGGNRIYLHYLQHWTSTATSAAFGYFGDGAGNAYVEWAQLILGTPFLMDFKGMPMPVGTAFVLKNESGGAMNNQAGGVVFSVAP